jgi:mannose-6-phosphate isomerase-like protein (cupin superfamily)
VIEEIFSGETSLAIIIRADYSEQGIKFFTPSTFSQQLGYMNRPKGYIIEPHIHKSHLREVYFTKETLYIKTGSIRADFYDEEKRYLRSIVLKKGDVILLTFGGHGFEFLEPSEVIEIKQGPYAGDQDKIRFAPSLIKNLVNG